MNGKTSWFGGWSWIWWILIIALFFWIIWSFCNRGYYGYGVPYPYGGYYY